MMMSDVGSWHVMNRNNWGNHSFFSFSSSSFFSSLLFCIHFSAVMSTQLKQQRTDLRRPNRLQKKQQKNERNEESHCSRPCLVKAHTQTQAEETEKKRTYRVRTAVQNTWKTCLARIFFSHFMRCTKRHEVSFLRQCFRLFGCSPFATFASTRRKNLFAFFTFSRARRYKKDEPKEMATNLP